MQADGHLQCAECKQVSDQGAYGWAAFLSEDLDGLEPTEVCVFCPDCAKRQFGWVPRPTRDDRTEPEHWG